MNFNATTTLPAKTETPNFSRQAKTDPPSKNRVRNFSGNTYSSTTTIRTQPPETHREITTDTTIIASGALGWLSKDPIGISGGLNQYVFCGNNPVNFTDPFGLCEEGFGKLDGFQLALDGAGMLPAVGIVPDALNTVISLFRGNWADAGFSAVAMVPLLGQVSTGGKYINKGRKIYRAVDRVEDGLSFGRKMRKGNAVRRLKRGEDVYTSSRAAAKNIQRSTGTTKKVIQDAAHGDGYYKHFHDSARQSGHSFFGAPQ